ncbi:MAG TPA: class I SAM-dependent methyltransferase [Burkholderiales bacterium]|jgi:hypothetical protein|nr:class I SAM-dependent methyltransferase [Burkholderiales bacterium]
MTSGLMRMLRSRAVKPFIEHVVVPAGDLLLAPLVLLAALLMKLVRRVGVYRMTVSRAILRAVGVFPIRDHYYEPMFDPRQLARPVSAPSSGARALPGLDLNEAGQLALIERFHWQEELRALPRKPAGALSYHYDNPNFGPGDAEVLYSLIRLRRPATLLEVGSGMSTLMALEAVRANRREDAAYSCRQICIEPYEMPWLEQVPGIEVLRQKVEAVDEGLFRSLRAGDILFIDSSHVIRAQGDVVREFLEILPLLARGVLVQVHDIFTPYDYPEQWLWNEVRLYNEQYLVEAFLTQNREFRILAAVHWLCRNHRARLVEKCPVLGEGLEPGGGPASLWLERA